MNLHPIPWPEQVGYNPKKSRLSTVIKQSLYVHHTGIFFFGRKTSSGTTGPSSEPKPTSVHFGNMTKPPTLYSSTSEDILARLESAVVISSKEHSKNCEFTGGPGDIAKHINDHFHDHSSTSVGRTGNRNDPEGDELEAIIPPVCGMD